MPINLSSRGNPRPSFRYGSAIRNNIVMSQNVTRYSNNAIDELFAQNEQGVWLDPGDMNTSKLNWRRNLFTYTEQFDNSFWGKQVATVSANAATGPFGGTTADLVYPSASGTFQGITLYYPSTRIRTVHTVSVYVKASGKNWMYFYNVNAVGGNGGVWFNLQTGTVGTVNAAYSNATMTSIGDGWYRCSASYTFSGGNDYFYILAGDANNSASCAANGTDGILIWGAQLELGSTLTSYQSITDFSTEFKAAFPQHALYQDSAGATPCTTAGEPVGLVIDKRLGGLNNLGPELLTNGNFDTDTVWTKGGGWTISGGVATYDGTSGTSAIYAPVSVSAGKTYLISLRVITNTGSGANTIYLGDSNVVRSVNLPPNEYTMFTHTVTGGGNFWIYGRASETFVVDNISVKEVYGNPAYQTTSGSRPTLGRNPYNGRRNLITYSEELDNTAWTKQAGCTVVANSEVGPLGITNADTLVNGSSGSSGILWSFAGYLASTQYTLSFWVKAGTATTLSVGVYQNTGFLNSTATVLSGSASLFGTSIQGVSNLTSTWTRIQLTFTTGTTGTPLVYFYPETSGVGTGLTNVLTQVQLETGANATQYQKVASTFDVTEQGFADCWHLHFDGSDDFMLTNAINFADWTGAQTRRNLFRDTDGCASPAWVPSGGITVTPNAIANPLNSTVNGSLIASNGTAVSAWIYQSATFSSSTFSLYVKANIGVQFIQLLTTTSAGYANFDIVNGVLGTKGGSPTTSSIESLGNGWYRCSMNAAAGTIAYFQAVSSNSANRLPTETITGSFYIYGAQIETGAITAYQKVGTDEHSTFAGIRKLSGSAGMVYEHTNNVNANYGSYYLLSDYIGNGSYSAENRGFTVRGVSSNINTSSFPSTNLITFTADISADSVVLRQDGVQIGANTDDQGTSDLSSASFYIGRRGGTSLPFNGHIYQLVVRGSNTSASKITQVEKFIASKTGTIIY